MVVGKGWDQSNQTSASIFPAPFSIQGRFLHSFSGVQLRSWSGSWDVAQLNGVGDAWFSTSNLLLASRSCECLYLRTDLYLGYFLRSFFFSVWRKISTSIVCSPVGVRWGSKRLFCWGGGLFLFSQWMKWRWIIYMSHERFYDSDKVPWRVPSTALHTVAGDTAIPWGASEKVLWRVPLTILHLSPSFLLDSLLSWIVLPTSLYPPLYPLNLRRKGSIAQCI